MKTNLVSVIIPTYNRGELAEDAILSVIAQTYNHFEVLLIDDGSSDNTAEIVKRFFDSRIKYYYKPNGGASSARNLGLEKAAGSFVAFLDSDDIWPKEYLEVMAAALEKNPDYGLAYSLFKDYFADGQIKDGFKKERFISGYLTSEYYRKTPCFLPSSTLIKKDVLDEICFDEALENHNDQDFFLRLSARTKFLFVGDTCIERRITEGSLSDRKFNYNPVRVLERFYYHIGGDKIIPQRIAMKKFSEHYRGLARRHYSEKHRKAAVELYKKAISCCPYCLKNYRGLLKAVFLKSEDDKMPDWRMPEPLLAYVKVSDEKAFIENNCTIQNNCG